MSETDGDVRWSCVGSGTAADLAFECESDEICVKVCGSSWVSDGGVVRARL